MGIETGEIVLYQDDRTDRSQKVELLKNTRDDIWEFKVLEDGPLFEAGEIGHTEVDLLVDSV